MALLHASADPPALPSDFTVSHPNSQKHDLATKMSNSAYLPQYGFGTELDFAALVESNHFLFRVHTPHPNHQPDLADTSELTADDTPAAYFIAPKFDSAANSPFETSLYQKSFFIGEPPNPIGTYADAATHLDWTSRATSPFVSTSFSFMWAIWEALRRHHAGVKKDVEIAVIEASAVKDRAITAVRLLRDSEPTERKRDHWKWYRFCQQSQSVFIYGYVPAHAVLSSVPILVLLSKLPSYLLRPPSPSPVLDSNHSNKFSTLASIGWDYTASTRSNTFRAFCVEMSARFQRIDSAVRLQDSTTGAVRLAAAFLRPWFRACVLLHPVSNRMAKNEAVEKLILLASAIAQWPGIASVDGQAQWWDEHPEAISLVRAVANALVDEVVEERRGRLAPVEAVLKRVSAHQDSSKRVSAIGLVLELPTENEAQPVSAPSTSAIKADIIDPAQVRLPPSPLDLAPAVSSPSEQDHVPTPITPPATPVRLRFVRSGTSNRARSLSVDSCESVLVDAMSPSSRRLPPSLPLPEPVLESVAARLDFGGVIAKSSSLPGDRFPVPIPVLPPSPSSPPPRALPVRKTTGQYRLSNAMMSVAESRSDADAEEWRVAADELQPSLLPPVELEKEEDMEDNDGATVVESSHLEKDVKSRFQRRPSSPLQFEQKSVDLAGGNEENSEPGNDESESDEDEWMDDEDEDEYESFITRYQSPLRLRRFLSPFFAPFNVPGLPSRTRVTSTRQRSTGMSDAASCLATGFLVGAFVTLCVLAPQRRPPALLYLT